MTATNGADLSHILILVFLCAWISCGEANSFTTSFKSVNYEPILLQISVTDDTLYDSDNALYLTCPHESDVVDIGPVIYDPKGQPVWMDTSSTFSGYICHDINVQTYENEQYITVWRGSGTASGYGQGTGLMIDTSYTVVKEISAGDGLSADLHEFHIPSASSSSALFTVYNPRQENLTAAGLDEDSWFLDSLFQEIDIETGDLIFSWSAFEHLNWWNETYAEPESWTGIGTESSPWDAVHMNSVDKDSDGNYLISCRHFHQLYKIDKDSGEILWRMGGMVSDFTMENGTNFEWQHLARWVDNGQKMTLFDNAASGWDTDESSARGLLINVDQSNMTVTLEQDFYPVLRNYSQSQGSVQLLDDGNYVLGYGSNPWITEHLPNGTVVWAASIGPLDSSNSNGNIQNYRAFKITSWVGKPTSPPDMAVEDQIVYVSWNGATQVSTWGLYGGDDSSDFDSLSSIKNVSKDGFETQITLGDDGEDVPNFVAVLAFSSEGEELGRTGVYEVGNGEQLSDGESEADTSAGFSTYQFSWQTRILLLLLSALPLFL